MANQDRATTNRIKEILRDIFDDHTEEMRASEIKKKVIARLGGAVSVKSNTLSVLLINFAEQDNCPYVKVRHGVYQAKPTQQTTPTHQDEKDIPDYVTSSSDSLSAAVAQ